MSETQTDGQAVADGLQPEPEPEPIRRGYDSTVDSVSPAGTKRPWVVSRITTDAVDRFETVVLPQGIDRSEYEQDRVVLWEHGLDKARGRVPIGRNLWIKPTPDRRGLIAKTEFADDEFSRGLHDLYRDGFLRGWSIYGTPQGGKAMTGPPTAAELKARPELSRCKTVYRSVLLREYSATPTPGNADCLTEEVGRSLASAVGRGLWVPETLRAMLPATPPAAEKPAPPTLPPLRGRAFNDVMRALEQGLARERSAMIAEAIQDARDIARGKV
jgi:Caudovirus prohead serine protease